MRIMYSYILRLSSGAKWLLYGVGSLIRYRVLEWSKRLKINYFKKNKNSSKGYGLLVCLSVCKTIEEALLYLKLARYQKRNALKGLVSVVLLLTAFTLSGSARAQAQVIYAIHLPAQSIAESLTQLSEQTDQMLLFSYDDAKNLKANSVIGSYTIPQALAIMLEGTGFSGGLTQKGVLMISLMELDGANQNGKGEISMNTKKKLLASLVGLFAASSMHTAVAQDQNDDAAQQSGLDEIIVTASKRGAGTSIQDTAMAISVLSGDTIEKRGLVGMGDYLGTLPGISMQDRGAGQNSVVIRGVASDPQAGRATSGIYFGETPVTGLGATSGFGGAGNADIKLVDIERIEVLRGPQGTLYGSDSMAGTVRVMPISPDLGEVSGGLATRYSQTGEEGGDNAMIQAVLNVPLIEDVLAIRGVVYKFDNSGYIQNVAASQPVSGIATTEGFGGLARDRGDVGGDEYTGFRLSALWQATDSLDITLGYTDQEIEQDGVPDVNLDLDGDYQQRRFNTGAEGSNYEFLTNEIDITSLTVNYDLGWAGITSASSWVSYDDFLQSDFTHLTFLFALSDQPYYSDNGSSIERFSQELRLASQFSGPLQFVSGLYYEDEERDQLSTLFWGGSESPPPALPVLSEFDTFTEVEQWAFFGEISYAVNEQLNATLGARHFDYDRNRVQAVFGSPGVPEEKKESGQTYKVNLSYTPNDDTLLYGQWAEGFRLGTPGTINANCEAAGIPSGEGLDSDTSENYELGLKVSLVDNRLKLNAAIYRIDWEGIPIRVNKGFGCFINEAAGTAKSEGVELELSAYLVDNLQANLSASYGEMTLQEDSSVGDNGDNLPGSADFNISIGLQYDFTLSSYDSFARIDYSYISEYYNSTAEGDLGSPPAGNFSQVNLKTGIVFDQVGVDIFVNNLTNDDALTWVDNLNGRLGAPRANRIRPRTVGLNIRYQF